MLGDQLSFDLSGLTDLEPERDVALMAEVAAETDHVPHHPKKIAFLFAAMRHFAEGLRQRAIAVDYVRLDARGNAGSLRSELARAVERHRPASVIVTEPGEWRVEEDIRGWEEALGLPVEVRSDDRLVCSRRAFARWARGRRQLRMELFYREMRQRTGLLMTASGEPEGGRWNFDPANRKPPPRDLELPRPAIFPPDEVTREVIELVRGRFDNRFGAVEPFWFAVTHEQAATAFDHFLVSALPDFGPYQDAMLAGEGYLFHAAISQYLNCGLLDPLESCRKVEAAYRAGTAPLNSAEGFIRQVIGWREYVRGVYWLEMPEYAARNELGNRRHLPNLYWSGETDLNCLRRVVDQTRREALSHHIQRLMVTGNFALLAGVIPDEICLWYLAVYADAYEWVELPNTLGMAMFADGGRLRSKPYAASGNYINKMSDFCRDCRYDVKQKNGENACPFNYLYWNFLIEHRQQLGSNQRLAQIYRSLDRFSEGKVQAIRQDAKRFLDRLEYWEPKEHG